LELLDHSIDDRKTVDVLVCSAGLSNRGSIEKTKIDIFRELMEVYFYFFKY